MTGAMLTIWDEARCRRAHEATLTVLAEVGVEVHYPKAAELFASLGARVDGTRVRIDPPLVEQALAAAPRASVLKSRGRDAVLDLRLGNSYFGTGSDCLYTLDPDSGRRRRVVLADVESLAALSEKLPNIDFVMSMGLPEDVPHAVDDVAPFAAMLAGTRKPLIVAPRTGEVLGRMLEMAAACGEPQSFAIYAMPAPPLQHDADGLSKLIGCAELQIPLVYAPAPSCGATAPMSVTAAAVIGNAEVLSGLVLHQSVRPGAPYIYGAGVGAMDMRTAVDAYTVPESWLGFQAACDLARFYGLPSFSYATVSDSKCLDEQWAVEAGMTTILGALSGATLLHDVGYLETGLLGSHESIVLGDELAGYARAFMRECRVDDEALALDEIRQVGPGGSFLARPYTRKHLPEFWRSSLLDHSVYDRWQAAGATTLLQRLKDRTQALRAEARAFELEPDARTRLDQLLELVSAERGDR